jgi:hypothetical protein
MFQWVQAYWARTLFRFTSWIFVCFALLFIFVQTPWFRHLEAIPPALFLLRLLGGVIGVTGAVTGLILWFGMAFFCARRDPSRFRVKLSWFILFSLAGPFGSAIYYFSVYRKRAGSG